MSSFLDKLNLRPQERRLVVFVAVVLFGILNVWLVWPHFKDWQAVQNQREKTGNTLQAYQKEIARTSHYQSKLKDLESEGGSSVVAEGQELDLLLTVQNQARLTGLAITSTDPRAKSNSGVTNQFFEEQALNIRVNTGTEELVNFLVSLASTNSLIRVQDMNLQPAQGGTRLDGTIMLVASYQKKAPTPPPPSVPAPVAASTKAAAAQSNKTNQPIAAAGTNTVVPSRKKLPTQPTAK
jgi:Tfp pilus assembly protein PilO